jgi:hypothetical protein
MRWRDFMDVLNDLPIDWANVNWPYVVVSVLLVFLCTLIGTSLSFKRTFLGAVLTALLFGAAFVYWTCYPHGLPLRTLVKAQQAAPAQPAPPSPATAGTPINPDTGDHNLSAGGHTAALIKRKRPVKLSRINVVLSSRP